MADKITLLNDPVIRNRAFNQFVKKLSYDIKLSVIQSIEAHIRPNIIMERTDKISDVIIEKYGAYFNRNPRFMLRHLFSSRRAVAQIEFYLLTPPHLVRQIFGFFLKYFYKRTNSN